MLSAVQLGPSLPAPTQLQSIKHSTKPEPQQRAEIYVFSSSPRVLEVPRAVARAPPPGWPLRWAARSGRRPRAPGRIRSQGRLGEADKWLFVPCSARARA